MYLVNDTEAYLAKQKSNLLVEQERGAVWSYHGRIGRRSYLVSTVVVNVLGFVISALIRAGGHDLNVTLALALLFGLPLTWVYFCLTFKRVRHVGAPIWIALLAIAPFINLILWIFLVLTPGRGARQAQVHEKSLATEREHAIYAKIGDELDSGTFDNALWTKAFADVGGDNVKARVRYIQERARFLRQTGPAPICDPLSVVCNGGQTLEPTASAPPSVPAQVVADYPSRLTAGELALAGIGLVLVFVLFGLIPA